METSNLSSGSGPAVRLARRRVNFARPQRRRRWRAAPPAGRRRGFTLVEMALAVAIVGVLLAVAAPVWEGWRDRVKTQQAQADITAVSVVIDAHLADNNTLPASLAAIGRANLRDPWGRNYVYLPLNTPANRGHARKDHSLVPLNTDYDLYSVGPDGATASPLTAKSSRDDIVRANNGRFVGPAKYY